jgi:hypothetical protein
VEEHDAGAVIAGERCPEVRRSRRKRGEHVRDPVVGQGLRDQEAGLINWAEADLEERSGFISYHVVVDGGYRVATWGFGCRSGKRMRQGPVGMMEDAEPIPVVAMVSILTVTTRQ